MKVFKDKNLPWEIICLNQGIENKILITINSTACCTPKFVFDVEPMAIFLYKTFNPEITNEMENIIERLLEMYSDIRKIVIPNTLEELDTILSFIGKSKGEEEI